MVDSVEAVEAVEADDESPPILPLQTWRERRGWGVRELERRSGVHRNTIKRIEGDWSWGRMCDHETIFQLADAFGIQWWQLEDDILARDLNPDEWLPPDEPLPDVPEDACAPLLEWMRVRRLTPSALTHETGKRYTKTVQGKYGEREERKWSSGIRYQLVACILYGDLEHPRVTSERAPAKLRCIPTRLEVARICRRLGVQPMQISEFRALPPDKRAPIRIDPADVLPYSSWPDQARVKPA